MQGFKRLFTRKTSIIGMIHVDPLPGTPNYKSNSFNRLIEKAKHEANIYSSIYSKYGIVRRKYFSNCIVYHCMQFLGRGSR